MVTPAALLRFTITPQCAEAEGNAAASSPADASAGYVEVT